MYALNIDQMVVKRQVVFSDQSALISCSERNYGEARCIGKECVLTEKGFKIDNKTFYKHINNLKNKGIIKEHVGYPNIFDDKYKLNSN